MILRQPHLPIAPRHRCEPCLRAGHCRSHCASDPSPEADGEHPADRGHHPAERNRPLAEAGRRLPRQFA